jgi:Uma2 family endonuclease
MDAPTTSPTAVAAPLVLHMGPLMRKLTDEEFFEFCQLNREYRIERTAEGDLIVTPPTGGKTGARNAELTMQLGLWARQDGSGRTFDSSTGFTLPNGAKRSPDAAWVEQSRWETLTDEQQEEFPPLCPDFVVELRSRRDPLALLREKMQEYIDNGARLGWLIDAYERTVYIYRPRQEVEVMDNPSAISGEAVLRGFILDVQALWG